MVGAPALDLYGRAYCHLCGDMEGALRALQAELGFALTVHDVDADPDLERRFGEWVPVLMGGEREICHYFLDEAALRRYLAGA
ncbi:MAG TPA: glutaredoxin family protein [Gammaproteobacteria bacterium]|nr:glutaredoxin family protein [Gammaproteobacteria bacterium]